MGSYNYTDFIAYMIIKRVAARETRGEMAERLGYGMETLRQLRSNKRGVSVNLCSSFIKNYARDPEDGERIKRLAIRHNLEVLGHQGKFDKGIAAIDTAGFVLRMRVKSEIQRG